MKCRFPKQHHSGFYPCGNCKNCRINLQRVWACRIQLESFYHPGSIFVTLTYDDDHVPMDPDGTPILSKPDFISFIEKIRYLTRSDRPLRYFGVGEYGSVTWRPHYHLVLFGLGLEAEPKITLAWSKVAGESFTEVAQLNPERSAYIAQYTLKKMTREGDDHLKGRPPEFAKMSTKPGIGFPAIGWLADALGKSSLIENGRYGPILCSMGDVFTHVRVNGRILPLGRYMRQKLRDNLGLSQDQRERAVQMGRFDADTGELFDEVIPTEFSPSLDINQANTPWRQYEEKQAHILAQARVDKLYDKAERQAQLPGLGRRI